MSDPSYERLKNDVVFDFRWARMTAYVLLHGGLHGSWCWREVATALRAAGHWVSTPDLPGRGASPAEALNCSLEQYTGALELAVRDAPLPPVVVAHSMGGVWITDLASRHPDAVGALVYVNAVVPGDGQSALQAWYEDGDGSALLQPGALNYAADQSFVSVGEEFARELFFGQCSEQQANYAIARLTPEPLPPLLAPITVASGFGCVPKVYIGGTRDAVVTSRLQKAQADRYGMRLLSLDGDHSLFYSARDGLVELLVDGKR